VVILRSASASPFVRKCTLAAHILGLTEQITLESANTTDPTDPLHQQNPLGKIPTLILDDGETIYDSAVILAYLDHWGGGSRLYPGDPMARIRNLRLEALADGIMDAAILQIYEVRVREEAMRSKVWMDRQAAKIAAALALLEAAPPAIEASPTTGTIALACALGYLDFRFAGAWRADHPALVAWLEAFAAAVPAFGLTEPAA
jgi:glutathione S-transferase